MDLLLIRLEGPLQAWGDVALDPVRPTRAYPSRSALAGLIASALGWTYRDGDRTTALQDRLRYAVREDRAPTVVRDFQTVDLGRESKAWSRWGVEGRGGLFSKGTHILEKDYLADASFLVALGLSDPSPVGLDDIEGALQRPSRPVFLGRKACPPSRPLFVGRTTAASPYEALQLVQIEAGYDPPPLRCWYTAGEGPMEGAESEVWDRRDFVSDRFVGSRTVVEGMISPPGAHG